MTTIDLTARLLAEIERREGEIRRARAVNARFHHTLDLIDMLAYLAALRKVVEAMGDIGTSNLARHKVLAAVAEALGVDVG